ncbi:MAG: hypothetical protein ACJ0BI_01445 [Paracoccaceae bacterium]
MTLEVILSNATSWLLTDFVHFLLVLLFKISWMKAHWFAILASIFTYFMMLWIIIKILSSILDFVDWFENHRYMMKTSSAYVSEVKANRKSLFWSLGIYLLIVFLLIIFSEGVLFG